MSNGHVPEDIPREYLHLAARPPLKDITLKNNLPRGRKGPPDPSRQRRWSGCHADLAGVSILPPELFQDILTQLDVSSLLNFRQVNRKAANFVHSMPRYAAVAAHARSALHGMFCIGTSTSITLNRLYEALCRETCETCSSFGGFLYLITCRRVCYTCVIHGNKYLPQPRHRLKEQYKLDDAFIDEIPSMSVLPGQYGLPELKISDTTLTATYYDTEYARMAADRMHGSHDAWVHLEKLMWMEELQICRKYPVGFGIIEDPRVFALRWIACVRTPWFGGTSRGTEWGFGCLKCRRIGEAGETMDRWRGCGMTLFSSTSFKEHWERCKLKEDVDRRSDGALVGPA